MFKKLSTLLYLRSVSRKEDNNRLIWENEYRYDAESDRILGSYTRLFSKQMVAILEIIDQELIKSYQLGLKLSREQVLKEKMVVLAILDAMGNLDTIPRKYKFEEAARIFSGAMGEAMEEEMRFYYEKFKKEGHERNMYTCHLQSVRLTILQELYGRRLPYT